MKKDRKTVFLLITTVGDILLAGELFIHRMKEIIRTCGHREASVVIWRPHPLSFSTIQSMKPELQGKYEELVSMFQFGQNTIYDETADYQAAMSIADAYLGTMSSSLFEVFKATGKPMYAINADWGILARDGLFLGTASAAMCGDKAFLFSAWFNGLFSVDCLSGKADFICTFKRTKGSGKLLYFGSCVYHNKIFYLPYFSREVAAYNQETRETEYIPLASKAYGALGAAVDGDKLYLFPDYRSDTMYVINMETLAVETCRLIETSKEVKGGFADKDVRFYGKQFIHNCFYRVCYEQPLIQRFDLNSGKVLYHELACGSSGFRGISYDGENFWLLSRGYEDLLIWNEESNDIVYSLKYPEMIKREPCNVPFYQIVRWESYMWLIPEQAGYIVKIHIETKKMKCIVIHPEGFRKILPGAHLYYEYQIKGSFMYLFPYECNMILCVDMNNDRVAGIPVSYNPVQYNQNHGCKLERILAEESGGIYDEALCSLETFLSIAEQRECCLLEEGEAVHEDGPAGDRIWELVKKIGSRS